MRGISLPISAIIVIALGLLTLVVIAAVFIKSGGGFARTTKQQVSLQECQSLCSQLGTWAMGMNAKDINCTNTNCPYTSENFDLLKKFKNCIDNNILANCSFQSADGYNCYIYNATKLLGKSENTYAIRCH